MRRLARLRRLPFVVLSGCKIMFRRSWAEPRRLRELFAGVSAFKGLRLAKVAG